MEPQIWRVDCEIIDRFSTTRDRDGQEVVSIQKLHIVQASTAHTNENT